MTDVQFSTKAKAEVNLGAFMIAYHRMKMQLCSRPSLSVLKKTGGFLKCKINCCNFNAIWPIISDLGVGIFFDLFILLADVIKLSNDIQNIILGESNPSGDACRSPNVSPKAKNAAPKQNFECNMMGHLFLMG